MQNVGKLSPPVRIIRHPGEDTLHDCPGGVVFGEGALPVSKPEPDIADLLYRESDILLSFAVFGCQVGAPPREFFSLLVLQKGGPQVTTVGGRIAHPEEAVV